MKIDDVTPIESGLAEVGRRLALSRKQQGLSQTELAAAAGIGVATLRRIEAGNDSQMGTWIKLLRALGLISVVDSLLWRLAPAYDLCHSHGSDFTRFQQPSRKHVQSTLRLNW